MVLCCDEKSQYHALERSQPGLPLGTGHVATRTHDYYRHGTTTLFAALDYLSDEIIATTKPQHRHQEWLAFLKQIDTEVPANLAVHLVPDNYATHKHPGERDSEGVELATIAQRQSQERESRQVIWERDVAEMHLEPETSTIVDVGVGGLAEIRKVADRFGQDDVPGFRDLLDGRNELLSLLGITREVAHAAHGVWRSEIAIGRNW